MKAKILTLFFLINLVGCAQNLENEILGSWRLQSDYEYPDVIVFRSDNRYFVYNSNSVQTESLGKKNDLPSHDILINDSYTSLTEKGKWHMDSKKRKLIFSERERLEEYTDFSEAYGTSSRLVFDVKLIEKESVIICLEGSDKSFCDTYIKNWSFQNSKGEKVKYKEFKEEYSAVGSQEYVVFLSGYEREIELTYDFLKEPDQLIIQDNDGNILLDTEMISTESRIRKKIQIRGKTMIKLKINSSEVSSKWLLKVSVI